MNEKTGTKPTDRTALLLMLAYVEAECRRMGADAAAQYAAMAAVLVPECRAAAPDGAPDGASNGASDGAALH